MKEALINLINDLSIRYALLYRTWGIISGIGTLLLIATYLPADIQGYYYTFMSLIALQTFLELGLYIVIVNYASHEWSGLHLSKNRSIEGNRYNFSRLVGLGRGVVKWYSLASVLFIVAVGAVGLFFFPQTEHEIWFKPWVFLVIFSGINLFFLPLISLLEGCGQVQEVYKFRLTQALISSFVLWYLLFSGFGLWSLVGAALIIAIRDIYLIFIHYRAFFKPLWFFSNSGVVDWKNEIWPMQWRLALQGIAGYFLLQIITPVIFKYHGAIEAGRIGMTMQIIVAVQTVAQIWLQTKSPLFGALIANQDYKTLNKIWIKATGLSLLTIIIIGLGLMFAVAIGNHWEVNGIERIVSPWEFGLLLFALLLSQIIQAESTYLRAFKREYFLFVGTIGGAIAGLLIWYLGSKNGVTGAVIGYTISMIIMIVWATHIFLNKKHPSLFME